MSSEERAKYKSLFVKTAREYLQQLNSNMGLFLKGEKDDDKLYESFIAAHSLKGQSFVIGYNSMGDLAFSIEKLLKIVIDAKTELKQEALEEIATSVKKMLASLEEIEKSGEEIDLSEEIKKLGTISI